MVRVVRPVGGGGGGRKAHKPWGPSPSLGSSQPGGLGPPLLWPQPLPRAATGESAWHPVSSGIVDCYYNVTHLPVGVTMRFRVACANRAGQGPFSNPSEKVVVRGAQGQWGK